MTIFVNADWSAIVPAGSVEAAFGVQPRDVKRLGIDQLPTGSVKQSPPPENKAAPKPANKGAARKDSVDGDRN